MIANTDYVGIAAVIASLGTAVPAIIAALYSRRVHQQVSTNGDPREIGQIATDLAKMTPGAEAPDHVG